MSIWDGDCFCTQQQYGFEQHQQEALQDDMFQYLYYWRPSTPSCLLNRLILHPKENIKKHFLEILKKYKRLYGLNLEEVLQCMCDLWRCYNFDKERDLEVKTLDSLEVKYRVFQHRSESKENQNGK